LGASERGDSADRGWALNQLPPCSHTPRRTFEVCYGRLGIAGRPL
jgi:hypothetical protein